MRKTKQIRIVSFDRSPSKKIVRIDRETAARMNFKSEDRFKATNKRANQLVSQIVRAFDEAVKK